MQCARLNHFVRFNPDGTVSRCGHMHKPPRFNSLEELDSSEWLKNIKNAFDNNSWPVECDRCRQTEVINQTSIRLNSNKIHKEQIKNDYLYVGGVLDNICNSACQFCNDSLSTKIGSLKGKNYPIVDNSNKFWKLPLDRIVHLDLNGGEPSASKNYKDIITNLPPNIKSIRLNTNCSKVLYELETLVEKGIDVTVTVSFDGIDLIHDYIRWPIPYDKFLKNLMVYKSMPVNLNLWTTVNALNISNFKEIQKFVNDNNFDHAWALLSEPDQLNVKYKNWLTESADVPESLKNVVAVERDNSLDLIEFLKHQDSLRQIDYKEYLK